MPAKHARHIALTAPLSTWVDDQVARGNYTSASDLVRTAIRLLKDQEEGKMLQQGRQPTAAPLV